MLSAHLGKINQIHGILHSRRPPTGFPQMPLGIYFSGYTGFLSQYTTHIRKLKHIWICMYIQNILSSPSYHHLIRRIFFSIIFSWWELSFSFSCDLNMRAGQYGRKSGNTEDKIRFVILIFKLYAIWTICAVDEHLYTDLFPLLTRLFYSH